MKNITYRTSLTIASAITAASQFFITPFVSAQSALEEIVITAQKRAENMQDVPISVNAVTADKLNKAGIEKIEDLYLYVPNLQHVQTGVSTQLYVRGVGNGINEGFEQSVGQYVDGIYYGRMQLIRAPFLDLEMVETLRGPQGVLFGKNSIAGAINMTTAKPTDSFEGSIALGYKPEYQGKETTLVLSGPVTETLQARLVYRNLSEEGYVKNTFLDEDGPQIDEEALRVSLLWDVSSELTAQLKVEKDTFETKGRNIEIVRDDAIAGGTFSDTVQSAPFYNPGVNATHLRANEFIADSQLDYQRQSNLEEFSDNELFNATLNLDYALGDHTLTFISGWVSYEFEELCDCDFNASDALRLPREEEYDQYSFEIRMTSPTQQAVSWIGGLYYQRNDIDFDDAIIIGDWVLGTPLTAFTLSGAHRSYQSSSDTWAAFGQATWAVNDAFRLTVGGRYSVEHKDGSRVVDVLSSDGSPAPTALAMGWQAALGVYSEQGTGHSVKGDRTENVFTPVVSAQYDLTDNTMLYASYSSGFKAGGYDVRANTPDSFEFEEEEADAFELGLKSSLFDGLGELSTALFYTDYKNLQTSQYDGRVGVVVSNAKRSVVQGVEIESRFLLAEGLTLNLSAAYLDFEYKDYTNGNCYNQQVPDGDVVNGVALCDYTGKTSPYAANKSGTLSLDYERSISNNLVYRTTLDINYLGESDTHTNLDPLLRQSAYTLVNLRAEISGENWNLGIAGKNIFGKEYLTYSGNVALSASVLGTNTFYGVSGKPRTLEIQGAYRF